MNLKAVMEGLLFVSGSEGITIEELSNILEIDVKQVQTYLHELKQEYQKEERGITLEKYGEHFKLTTKKEHKPYYEKLVTVQDSPNLSQSALETLAIIAYNAGLGNVEKWIKDGVIKADGSDIENIPYKETENYVRKILRDYQMYLKLYE